MKKSLIAALVLSFLNVGAALAQPRTQDSRPAPQTRYQTPTHFDFDNDEVEVSLHRPDSEVVDGVKKLRQTSLLKIRQHFQPEMLKSVEGL